MTSKDEDENRRPPDPLGDERRRSIRDDIRKFFPKTTEEDKEILFKRIDLARLPHDVLRSVLDDYIRRHGSATKGRIFAGSFFSDLEKAMERHRVVVIERTAADRRLAEHEERKRLEQEIKDERTRMIAIIAERISDSMAVDVDAALAEVRRLGWQLPSNLRDPSTWSPMMIVMIHDLIEDRAWPDVTIKTFDETRDPKEQTEPRPMIPRQIEVVGTDGVRRSRTVWDPDNAPRVPVREALARVPAKRAQSEFGIRTGPK